MGGNKRPDAMVLSRHITACNRCSGIDVLPKANASILGTIFLMKEQAYIDFEKKFDSRYYFIQLKFL